MRKKANLRQEKLFLLIAPLLIGLSIVLLPINRVPDEMNHARMTMGILYDENSEGAFDWYHSVPADTPIDKSAYVRLFSEKVDFSNERFKLSFGLKNLVHLPQLLGMMIGKFVYPSIGVMVFLGRLFNGLFYVLCCYFLIKFAKFGKDTMIFLSLLPIMLQQAASLSYDVANVAAIFAFFSLMTNLLKEPELTKKKVLLILLSTLSLYVTKTNNLLLLGLYPFLGLRLPLKYERANQKIERIETFFKRHWWKILIATVLAAVIVLFIDDPLRDQVINLLQVVFNSTMNDNLNHHLNTILTVGMFGFMGNFNFQLPLWLIFIDVIALFVLSSSNEDVLEEVQVSKMTGITFLLMIIIQICAIIAGMYYAWTPLELGEGALISVGAQGRYFTPFLIFLVPYFRSIQDTIRVRINPKAMCKLNYSLIIVNFMFVIYLALATYWFPGRSANWLIRIFGG